MENKINFTPFELLAEVGEKLFEEERRSRSALVRNMIMRQKGLSEKIVKIQKDLTSKEKQLEEVNAKIEKFKGGDWDVLKQFEKKYKPQTSASSTNTNAVDATSN